MSSTSRFFSIDEVKMAVADWVITFVFCFLISADLVQDFGERYFSIDRHTTRFEEQTIYPTKYNTSCGLGNSICLSFSEFC